jgi:nicotinic acid mononucleotide adenylyltransferase
MVTLPTKKFVRCLHSLGWNAGDRLAFLSLSGALSPVHTQHMHALEAARLALKRAGWTVVAGFLAPTPDNYLKEKLGIAGWGFEKRVRLCELACGESEWVDVCGWGEYRSYRLCAALREYLVRECGLRGRGLTGVEIMGSDAAIRILDKNIEDWDAADPAVRHTWYRGRVVCCLLRPGSNSAREREHIEKHTACRAIDLGVELVVVEPESISPSLQAVSSTEIRDLLEAGDVERLRNRGWLHPDVLAALANEKSGL